IARTLHGNFILHKGPIVLPVTEAGLIGVRELDARPAICTLGHARWHAPTGFNFTLKHLELVLESLKVRHLRLIRVLVIGILRMRGNDAYLLIGHLLRLPHSASGLHRLLNVLQGRVEQQRDRQSPPLRLNPAIIVHLSIVLISRPVRISAPLQHRPLRNFPGTVKARRYQRRLAHAPIRQQMSARNIRHQPLNPPLPLPSRLVQWQRLVTSLTPNHFTLPRLLAMIRRLASHTTFPPHPATALLPQHQQKNSPTLPPNLRSTPNPLTKSAHQIICSRNSQHKLRTPQSRATTHNRTALNYLKTRKTESHPSENNNYTRSRLSKPRHEPSTTTPQTLI
ncbi:hypothetical protein KC19_5G020700, partial [Ceratodon purpureus]